MAARMDFVGSLLNTATTHMSSDLFISRLAGTTVVESVKDLQEQFRNKVSHSATASEGYQYSLIEQYEPKVRTLLQDLLCLADVRLVRVPMFFRRRGKMMRRMEIYRGVVPEVAEEQVTSESLGAAVEYDHLVLLDGEDRTLDLFPMYQLVENEATRYERHLCFMKAAKDKTRTIRGEDAHTSIELDLVGYEDLVSMQEALKTKAAR